MRSLIAIFVAGALLSTTVPSNAANPKWMIGKAVATETGYALATFTFASTGVCVYHYFGYPEAANCTVPSSLLPVRH
jgi:hypothetical protein